MSEPVFAEIGVLLKAAIGLDVEVIGRGALANAVKRRQATSGIADLVIYAARLRASHDEVQALIDAVVVPETWFFRDREAFNAMTELLPRAKTRPLRLLSLPCATGEEPYSMAIALLAAGFAPDHFVIEAFDVSVTCLAQTSRAVYGENAFRGCDPGLRETFFEPAGGGHRPVEAVRRQVRFGLGNLLDPFLLEAHRPFDVVFCRNLLIYFDRPTQEEALGRIRDIMAAESLLFVAPSEQSLATSSGFASVRQPRSCGFRPSAGGRAPVTLSTASLAADSPEHARLTPHPPIAPPPTTAQQPPRSVDRPISLNDARRLADAGRLKEATQICEAALAADGPSAEPFCLLGLIHEAAGDQAAGIRYYRKALYLDRNHREALLHLSLVLRRMGDPGGLVLEARLSRLPRTDAPVR